MIAIRVALVRRWPGFIAFAALAVMARPCFSQDSDARGESESVVVHVQTDAPEPKAWVGQRLPFFVKLKAPGPFVGAAGFSVPSIPRALIVKVGTPVVSSETGDDDQDWTVQTHEFALFSQATGTVSIPDIQVRFSCRSGYTGPVSDHVETSPGIDVQIQTPDNYDPDVFVVSTHRLEVNQSWEPPPGDIRQGDLIRRTIQQSADDVAAMALAPPILTAPDNVRVYPDDPAVDDDMQRGAFTGRRTDVITYVPRESGTVTFPAAKYVWWDPTKNQYDWTTLPAVTYNVAAVASATTGGDAVSDESSGGAFPRWWALGLMIAVVLLGCIAVLKRRTLKSRLQQFWSRLYPPDRVAVGRLRRACRNNDPVAAEAAWQQWQNSLPGPPTFTPALQSAVTDLHRHRYGNGDDATWDGTQLSRSVTEYLAATKDDAEGSVDALPPLNPV
ncbi:BatD family protein [Crateriforma spongiae]|uniref:BatD family protein n=1 Tax=Crateriforma spongiae TaxID=2724528 RepID=UPI001444FCEA|nr:BatD family protein [Crateriforma spongiae]